MATNSTVNITFFETTHPLGKRILPSAPEINRKLVKIEKSTLKASLKELAADVEDVFSIPSSENKLISLSEVSISVEITREGGLSWIGSVTAGTATTMTLTFRREQKKA